MPYKKLTIPITRSVLGEEEKKAILKPLETGWLVQGPYVKQFEELFSGYTGSKFSKAVTSCTTALHLALVTLGVGKGDRVIVPSFTYVASANAVEYTGAEVVFCDIDLRTFNIDTAELEHLLKNDNTVKAIMPVDLFGLCADMPKIMKLAQEYNVKVVEDAACGFDSWVKDKHAGTMADIACFSFHPRKSITTGEGGMITTDDEAVYNHISQLCDHGASKSDFLRHKEKGGSLLPDFTMRGYNYRMTDMQGALGVCQMQKSKEIMAGRRRVAVKYDTALAQVKQFERPSCAIGYVHGYQSYVCLFSNGESLDNLSVSKIDRLNVLRNKFMDHLEEKGVATRQGTHAVHTLGYYKKRYGLNDGALIQSYAADRLSITLPLYATMTEDEFQYIISNIKEALECAELQAQ